LLKTKDISRIWGTFLPDMLTLFEGESHLAYKSPQPLFVNFLTEKQGHMLYYALPVFSNSIGEGLQSQIYKAEKHLDSKGDPRLSFYVAICLSVCLENVVMRANPRRSQVSERGR
jgi:hypothetical protein